MSGHPLQRDRRDMPRKFHRKAIYASVSKRQELWEHVSELCARAKKPSPAEVRSVLPLSLYNAYVKRLRTFVLQKAADTRPEVIETFIAERRMIRSRRKNHPESAAAEYEYIHQRFAEKCEEDESLYRWIRNLDSLLTEGHPQSRSAFIQSQDVGADISLAFHTVPSFNRQYADMFFDSAEREAVVDYYHRLEKEFGATEEWNEILPQRTSSRLNSTNFSAIRL